MDQHCWQDVDWRIDRQSPKVFPRQEGEEVGGAVPAGVQEVAGQLSAEVPVPAGRQAGQARRRHAAPISQCQFLHQEGFHRA